MNKSVERAVSILEYIVNSDRPVGISEIARALGMPKSSAYDCLSSLAEMGCLDQSSSGFVIGRRSQLLGMKCLGRTGIGENERRIISELHNSTGLAVSLWQREGPEVICTAVSVDNKLKRLYSAPGDSCDMHLTAPGKAILARSDDEEVGISLGKGCYSVHTSRSIVNYYQLATELAKIRRRGYATEVFENDSHIWAVAAAFRQLDGSIMAVSLELWSEKSTEPDEREIGIYAAEALKTAGLLEK